MHAKEGDTHEDNLLLKLQKKASVSSIGTKVPLARQKLSAVR